jgi:general nucleoside transport system ATP-binding protein
VTSALELSGIHRRFGSVHALRGADFSLLPGELHALLGENGAGKSTLMHIAAGLLHPDAGEVRIGGVPRTRLSPRAARHLGIGMVHQHLTSVPALTVAENVALAAGWPVAPGPLRERVRELGERVGLPLDPGARVERLSVGLRQRLEIVKALASDARILLLDEPTAVLAPSEALEVLGVIRRFTGSGGSAVLITHKLDEALAVADRVTVLRRGTVVLTAEAAELDTATLAAAMIGETELDERVELSGGAAARTGNERPLVRVESLDVARDGGLGIAVRGASLAVWPGEIVGIAAVEGNGQRELLRAIAGRIAPLRGLREVAEPVGFIPEDRTTEGLIPEMTLTENLVLGSSRSDSWILGPVIDWRQAEARTAALLAEYSVAAPGPEVPAAALSGGNQQRVVVARELSRRPRVVVAENPTRGLDIRATAMIHARLRSAAAEGAAVLFHSSDLDEVLELAGRVVVASRGGLIEPPPGATRDEIGGLMLAGA